MALSMFVADLSVIARGISEILEERDVRELVIPAAVLAQIEKEARANHETGFVALKELEKLTDMSREGRLELSFPGERPRFVEEADAIARETARFEGAILLTADSVQAALARAEGVEVLFYESDKRPVLSVEKFFDETTMSVHFRDGVPTMAKKGVPGRWQLVELGKKPMSVEEIEDISREIVEKAKRHPEAFVEIDREGGTVVQYDKYRIVLCRPPFSDGHEVTVVRPVVKLNLDDYDLDERLEKRIKEKAEGILISGAPGEGKSTLASAIAEFYASQKKIVKTMESPRDLQVSKAITQYSALEGSMEKTSDILLLSRPDYTIYDELRKTNDFEIFTDMRLAGVGMVGVTHASRPIDAIQRFLARVEMGVMPQVIDTVLFIRGGQVADVYTLEMTVKVPSGMVEADLARPVVVVKDFFTGEAKYEIYTYGEETTIVPVQAGGGMKGGAFGIAAKRIADVVAGDVPGAKVDAEVVSPDRATVYVDESAIPKLIGKSGRNIEALEKRLGIHIDVRSREEMEGETEKSGANTSFKMKETKRSVTLDFGKKMKGKNVDLYADGDFVASATISRKGDASFDKKSEIGEMLANAKKIEARS